ncbi:MAG: hypothetical protein ABIK36_14100 [Pseudomonadota bacterium]
MFFALGYEPGDSDRPMVGMANGHSTITPSSGAVQPAVAVDAI